MILISNDDGYQAKGLSKTMTTYWCVHQTLPVAALPVPLRPTTRYT